MGYNRTEKVKTRKARRLKPKKRKARRLNQFSEFSARINQLIREGKVKVYMSYREFKNRKNAV